MSDEAKHRRVGPAGLSAVAAGSIALVIAVLHFFAGPLAPQPALEDVVTNVAVSIKEAAEAKLRGETYAAPLSARSRDVDDWIRIASVAAGLAAIVLAVIAWIRREDLRASGSAVLLGSAAIAFQFATIAIGVIVAAILIAAVLGALGISP